MSKRTHIITLRLTDEEYCRLQLIIKTRPSKHGAVTALMRKALYIVLDKETSVLSDRVREIVNGKGGELR